MKLNPFRGLDNPREVCAWGFYDLANQSFTLLINTLLFSIYFKEIVVNDPRRGDSLWSLTFAGSMLLVVILSPVLGAVADSRGWRKRFLVWTGVGCAALTASFGLIGPGAVLLAVLLYVPANLLYQIGENFLASFLPSVSTPRNLGRVSATGWAMGYVGALLLLILTAAAMKVFGLATPGSWRPFFVFAGVWFLINMIPAVRTLKEPPSEPLHGATTLVGEAVLRMRDTVRSAGSYGQLVRFLTAFFVYGMGVQVIIAFASIIARDFGFETTKLVLFVLQLTVTAGIAAIATAKFQDRIGAKATILLYLFIWAISALGMLAMSLIPGCPEWVFWIVGNGIGFGIGGIGTASRAIIARFTPGHKTAEFFGLWGMVYKLAGVLGVASFGQVKAWIGMPASLALLLVFFVVGFALML
ncbi:MAG: MFS transporter, partial [Phycisphaerales bacterium]|nr:MFS transporter [Phycisphaerales bacterium]